MTETPYGAPVRSTPTATTDSPYSTTTHGMPTNGTAYGEQFTADPGQRPMPQGSDDSPSMKDKASDSAEAGKQAAGQVAQQATDQAKDVAQEAAKQARDLVGEARNQLTEQAGAQHRSLVTNLRSLADELSSMAQRSENQGTATELVSQAGDRAHGVANWLDQREPGDLLGEARSFAQRRPGTFLLGAVVAGVVAGRLTRGAVAAHSDDSGNASGSSDQSGARHQAVDTGYQNAGYQNAGYQNAGYQNAGYQNAGYQNAGYQDAGYQNVSSQGVGYQSTGAVGGQAGYGTTPPPSPGYSVPPTEGLGGVTS